MRLNKQTDTTKEKLNRVQSTPQYVSSPVLYRPEYKANNFGRVESHGVALGSINLDVNIKISAETLSLDSDRDQEKHQLLWELMSEYLGHDVIFIQNHIKRYTNQIKNNNDLKAWTLATSKSLRDRLVECFNDT